MSILSIDRIRQYYAWHKWTGLITGLFLLIINLSGAVAVFKDEIDRFLTPAKVVRPTGTKASIDQILDALRKQLPGSRPVRIALPERPDAAYVITMSNQKGEVTEGFGNPYTGEVTGTRQGETFANVLRQLHLRFYLFGFWGRVVVGIFGVVFLVSTITGVLIYWRFMRGVFSRGMRFWQIRSGLQLSTSDLHKLVGVGALVFNLLIAFTGAFLGLENLTRYAPQAQDALQPKPQAIKKVAKVSADARAPRLSIDSNLLAAEAALPGFRPNTITFPGGGVSVIHGKLDGSFARDRASFVVVNAAGEAIETFNQTGGTGVSRFYNFIEPLHYGTFGGVSTAGTIVQSIYLLLGLASAFLSITGFMLWWLKWRKRTRHSSVAAGRPSASVQPGVAVGSFDGGS